MKFRIETEEGIPSQEIEKKNGSACSARNADVCFNRPRLCNEDAYHGKDHENEDYPKSLGSIPGKKLKDWKNLLALGHQEISQEIFRDGIEESDNYSAEDARNHSFGKS